MKRLLRRLIQRYRTKDIEIGRESWVGKNCNLQGHISVGNHVTIGERCMFVSTRAKLIICDNVIFGPNVTIYTGDHAYDIIGKHISDVTDRDKEFNAEKYDRDVIIESGCWIGAGAIILKGVVIGRGSIIGAGAIVTKSIPPYSVYVGVPSLKVSRRFSTAEIRKHEDELIKKHGMINSFKGERV